MSKFRQFTPTEDCIAKARKLGLYGNVGARLEQMAKYSATFTHPKVNRRYEGFLLKVEDGRVIDIMRFDPKKGQVTDETLKERLAKRQKIANVVGKIFAANKTEMAD